MWQVVTPAAHVRQGSKKQAEIPLIFVLLIAAFAIGSWFGLARRRRCCQRGDGWGGCVGGRGIDWQHCVPLCGSFGLATSRAAGRKLNAFPTGRRKRDRRRSRRRGGAGKGQEAAEDAGHGGAVEAGEGMWMRMTSAAQAAHGGS